MKTVHPANKYTCIHYLIVTQRHATNQLNLIRDLTENIGKKEREVKIINKKISIYMYFYSLVTGDMRQTTKHAKSDHSDEEDIPPNKPESIGQHTSLDIDLRPPYNISSRINREPASGRTYGRKKVTIEGISYID